MANFEQWCGLVVRNGFQALVVSRLHRQGIQAFVQEPHLRMRPRGPSTNLLFHGYVFAQLTSKQLRLVLGFPGVLGCVKQEVVID